MMNIKISKAKSSVRDNSPAMPPMNNLPLIQESIGNNLLQAKIESHQSILKPITDAHINRANHQAKHPVIDFLFEYYSFRAAKLLQWSPGLQYQITDISEETCKTLATLKFGYFNEQGSFAIDAHQFPQQRLEGLSRTIDLLSASYNRQANYGCFGLHEWAMVYEQKDIRHNQLSLRFSQNKIREIVEQTPLKCSHYDAYRFFSKTAVKFNSNLLNKDNREEYEQPACLHANMDIYRWAFKYYPWIDSELIRKSFLLAKDIREVDMRASPYDVSNFGLDAIKIETVEGKKQYVDYQKSFYSRAQPLRLELITKLVSLAYSTSSNEKSSI